MDYQEKIIHHYKKNWSCDPNIYLHDRGPSNKLPYNFRVLEFSPNQERTSWIYATCCMSQENDKNKIELHILSSIQDTSLVELLTVIAYYHRENNNLGLNHTVNFGKSWQDDSSCTFGFISLPYLDGPDLENLIISDKDTLKCYWLIPVTEKEVEFKMKNGTEELENLFENNQFNYENPKRNSLV